MFFPLSNFLWTWRNISAVVVTKFVRRRREFLCYRLSVFEKTSARQWRICTKETRKKSARRWISRSKVSDAKCSTLDFLLRNSLNSNCLFYSKRFRIADKESFCITKQQSNSQSQEWKKTHNDTRGYISDYTKENSQCIYWLISKAEYLNCQILVKDHWWLVLYCKMSTWDLSNASS
jgi:hypothetical protein